MVSPNDLSDAECVVLRQLSFDETMSPEQIRESIPDDYHHPIPLDSILKDLYDKGLIKFGADFDYRLPRQKRVQYLITAIKI